MWNNSDLKKSGCSLTSPASVSAGSPFVVSSTCTVKNQGPFGPASYSDSNTLTLPGDCTTSSANPQVNTGSLANGARRHRRGLECHVHQPVEPHVHG